LVIAVAWGALPLPVLSYLTVAFFYGLRTILVHQLLDYENDRAAGTRTTAITLGVPATMRFLQLTFALEALCTIIFLILIVYAGLPVILLIGLAWPLFLAILRWSRKDPIRLDSYSYIPLADVHESLMPLILAAGVAIREESSMIAIVPIVIVLFLNRHFERLVRPLIRWKETADG
jgi:4-hydroxybenzoate polyprenyltransferase